MSLWRLRKRAIAAAETAGRHVPASRPSKTRPCKYDGEPIVYDPRENVWTRRGLHEYGRHDGPCGRKLVLLRLTPGTPPSPPGGRT